MKYKNCHTAIFRARPNRFIALVELNGQEERVHVKNTGRCAELLQPGNTVYLEKCENPNRKTAYDLIAVEKQVADGTRIVNMDSMAPNQLAKEWLEGGALGRIDHLRAETKIGDSRFDFSGEQNGRRMVIEVKGCTLETDGIARFPDAPTERGVKHVRGLSALAKTGVRCVVLIVVQMKGVRIFRPNWQTQPEFGRALIEARTAGVEVLAVDCRVRPGVVEIDHPIEVDLRLPKHDFCENP